MKEEIIQALEKILADLGVNDLTIELTTPTDSSHGDYATNIALQLAKKLGKSPLEIAQQIAAKYKILDTKYLDKVVVAPPGFINFYLSQDYLLKNLQNVITSHRTEQSDGDRLLDKGKQSQQGDLSVIPLLRNDKLKGKKVIVEYSSPNIAKPFTVGHFRSTIIGDAIANLYDAVGYTVYRDNHLGDWGTQFGKQIYAIKTWGSEEELDKSEDPIKDLVALYVKFHQEAEKNPELEDEGRKWFKKLEDGDKEARRLWQKCIDWSFKEFDRIYAELGVHFTENNGRGYGEAYFEGKMQPIIDELKTKGFLKEDKGAQLVFYPEDKLPPLMIIKNDGATLYATRDLAADKFRLSQYGKDILVVNEVGAEQNLYWRQIFELEFILGWYKPGQRIHVSHGMFRFKEGKMSTRKGNVVWLQDVIQEAKNRAAKLADGKNDNFQQIADQVAIGALKWNDLKKSSNLDIAFDWDEVLNMQGNSGPYVQYSYVRTQSILSKSQANAKYEILNTKYSPNPEELQLLRKLYQFPDTIEQAAKDLAPSTVCTYLFELAQLFNNFYQKYRILNAEKEEEKEFRLALTRGVGIILRQGLGLLGIATPEKM